MEVSDIINTQPLGSIERLYLIQLHGNIECSSAATRCIKKRLKKKQWINTQ